MATTPEQKYFRAKTALMIVGFISAAIIVFVLLSKCNGEKSASIAYNNIKDRLQKVLDDSAKAKEIAKAKEEDIRQLELALADAVDSKQVMNDVLRDEFNRSAALEKQLRKAKADKDTIEIVKLADSCCSANSFLREKYNASISGQKLTDSLYRLRVKKADSLATHWHMEYTKCFSAVEFSAGELPKIKPKGKVCAVVTGVVDGGILGIGGGFTYISPHSILVGVKGYATNVGPLYTVEFGVPLNFKRK